jgi:hypothetical protein
VRVRPPLDLRDVPQLRLVFVEAAPWSAGFSKNTETRLSRQHRWFSALGTIKLPVGAAQIPRSLSLSPPDSVERAFTRERLPHVRESKSQS